MDNDDRLRWLNHKGKKILYIDYSELSAIAMVAQVEKVIEFVNKSNESFLKSVHIAFDQSQKLLTQNHSE